MIGFVGESGKSTIVSLLMGQYSNYRGELKLSNYEIKDINIYPYMALVSLESYLFSGTLKDNLSVAKDASEKEMNSVLERWVSLILYMNKADLICTLKSVLLWKQRHFVRNVRYIVTRRIKENRFVRSCVFWS